MTTWNRFAVEVGPLFARTRDAAGWVVVRAAAYAADRRTAMPQGYVLALKDTPFFARVRELPADRAPFRSLAPWGSAYAVRLALRKRSTLVFELRVPEGAPEATVWARFLLCSARASGEKLVVARRGLELWRSTTAHASAGALSEEKAIGDVESWVARELKRVGAQETLNWHNGEDLAQFKALVDEFSVSADALRSEMSRDLALHARYDEIRRILHACTAAYEGKAGDAVAIDRALRSITKRSLLEKMLALEKEAERVRALAKAA